MNFQKITRNCVFLSKFSGKSVHWHLASAQSKKPWLSFFAQHEFHKDRWTRDWRERGEKKSIRKMHSWNSSRLHERAECAVLERDGIQWEFIVVLVEAGWQDFGAFDNIKRNAIVGSTNSILRRACEMSRGNCDATFLRFYRKLTPTPTSLRRYFIQHKIVDDD